MKKYCGAQNENTTVRCSAHHSFIGMDRSRKNFVVILKVVPTNNVTNLRKHDYLTWDEW